MTSFVNRIRNSSQIEEDMVLCTEFMDSTIRILILRKDSPPFLGEVKTWELWDIAKSTFSETEENFHEETRNVLSGKDASFDFFLEDETFEWRKGIWSRGLIKVCPVYELNKFSGLAQHFLLNVGNSRAITDKVQSENEELKESIRILKERLEDMISIKSSMEKNLYTKFLLVLNTKKRKIRELEEENNVLKRKIKKSVYDEPTDAEMSEEDGECVLDLNVKKRSPEVDEKRKKPIKGTNGMRLRNKNNVLTEPTQINRATFKTDEIFNPVSSTSKRSQRNFVELDFPNPPKDSQKSPLLEKCYVSEYDDIIDKVINSKPSTSKQKNEILNDSVFSSSPNAFSRSLDKYEISEFDHIVDNVLNTKASAIKINAEVSTTKILPSPAKIPRIVESDDEDFELKDEGDSFEKNNVNSTKLNNNEEESDVDLFSQSF